MLPPATKRLIRAQEAYPMTFHLAWGKNSWFNLVRPTCELEDLESLTVTVYYNRPSLQTLVCCLAKTTQI